jgi:putative flippase GtrA
MFKLAKQLVKFMFVGSVAFVTDFGTYTTLTRVFVELQPYYVIVSICTSFLAMLVAYFLNHNWTFRQTDKPSVVVASRYFIVTTSGLVLQNGLLAGLVELLGWHDLVAKFSAVVVVGFAWNFVLSRNWVFTGTTQDEVVRVDEK